MGTVVLEIIVCPWLLRKTQQTLRVATAQGKQGIWKSIFPDRENTRNLPKIFKIWFYTGNLTSTQGKFGGEKKRACNLSCLNLPCGCVVPF